MHTTDTDINALLTALEEVLGTGFRDRALLTSAITHRSFLNENRHANWDHNERLEFLGDAVLELVVTDVLFQNYPKKPEGELTAIRAALVNTGALAAAAEKIDLNRFLLFSKGEAKDTGRARQYILANAFEALIGALYLDQGYESAAAFIRNYLLTRTEEVVANRLWQDPKSRFQELAQEQTSITPTYTLLSQTGPDHDRVFTIGVFLHDQEVARGSGKSKQEAERAAAEAAIQAKGW